MSTNNKGFIKRERIVIVMKKLNKVKLHKQDTLSAFEAACMCGNCASPCDCYFSATASSFLRGNPSLNSAQVSDVNRAIGK